MQRLTKYSLLLTAIRKHITDENDAEIMDAMVRKNSTRGCVAMRATANTFLPIRPPRRHPVDVAGRVRR